MTVLALQNGEPWLAPETRAAEFISAGVITTLGIVALTVPKVTVAYLDCGPGVPAGITAIVPAVSLEDPPKLANAPIPAPVELTALIVTEGDTPPVVVIGAVVNAPVRVVAPVTARVVPIVAVVVTTKELEVVAPVEVTVTAVRPAEREMDAAEKAPDRAREAPDIAPVAVRVPVLIAPVLVIPAVVCY